MIRCQETAYAPENVPFPDAEADRKNDRIRPPLMQLIAPQPDHESIKRVIHLITRDSGNHICHLVLGISA